MRKILLILILILLPNVNALAISPTKLEFKLDSDEMQEKEFFIYNNNNYKTNYLISSNKWFTFYPGNTIELNPNSNAKVKAVLKPINAETGNYESKIYIKEIIEGKGITLENGLAIKAFIDILYGDESDSALIKEEDKSEIKVSKIFSNHSFILLGIVLALALANLIKRFK